MISHGAGRRAPNPGRRSPDHLRSGARPTKRRFSGKCAGSAALRNGLCAAYEGSDTLLLSGDWDYLVNVGDEDEFGETVLQVQSLKLMLLSVLKIN
jgi:hypothetical protein